MGIGISEFDLAQLTTASTRVVRKPSPSPSGAISVDLQEVFLPAVVTAKVCMGFNPWLMSEIRSGYFDRNGQSADTILPLMPQIFKI
jgi:hypothetical protein